MTVTTSTKQTTYDWDDVLLYVPDENVIVEDGSPQPVKVEVVKDVISLTLRPRPELNDYWYFGFRPDEWKLELPNRVTRQFSGAARWGNPRRADHEALLQRVAATEESLRKVTERQALAEKAAKAVQESANTGWFVSIPSPRVRRRWWSR